MENFIIKDGVKYYLQKRLQEPKREDFFKQTGEVEFGGRTEPTGHFNDEAFEATKRERNKNLSKVCEHKAGYYCKNLKCNFPKCVEDKAEFKITDSQYFEAKKITDAYEAEQKRLHEIKLEALKQDLSEYFKNNKVGGHFDIKEFRLEDEYRNHRYTIIPTNPSIEEDYDGENNEDIEAISKKHNISVKFVYWMYHK